MERGKTNGSSTAIDGKRLLLSMRSNRHRRLWTKWSLVLSSLSVALEWLQNFKSTCTSLGIAPSERRATSVHFLRMHVLNESDGITEQIQETCIPYFLCRVMSSVGGWFFDHTYLLLLLSYYYENTIMTSIYYILYY